MSKQSRKVPHAGEEDCQDRVCDETKEKFNSWFKNNKIPSTRDKNPECPLDRNMLGRNTWSLLHTMAAHYPKNPTPDDKVNMKEFITLMSIMYPCKHCAQDFRKEIQQSPPQVDNRDTISLWFCQMHNRVNKKLNKSQFDCSKIEERWRTGPKDGSCDW